MTQSSGQEVGRVTVGVGTGVVVGGMTEVVMGREKVLLTDTDCDPETLMVRVNVSDSLTDTDIVDVRESESVPD